MQNVGTQTVITTVISVIITLVITFIFNKLVALPAAIRKQRRAERTEIEVMRQELDEAKAKIACLEPQVNALPGYRQQSLTIQQELKSSDTAILSVCSTIQESLQRLEKREKNALRAKLLSEYRLFTNRDRNPLQAWTEMEHHSFFELVSDYEALGGNDYVHSTVLPAMNSLELVRMEDTEGLARLMASRRI
jgi:hypothetical protein